MREVLRSALRSVLGRPLRNALAIVGVSLATATFVALLALSAAAQHQVLEGLQEQPMLTTLQVSTSTQRAGVAPRPLNDAAVSAIASIDGVREVLPVVVVPVQLRIGDRTPSGTITGITTATRAPYALIAGRAPDASEVDALVLSPAAWRAIGGSAADWVGRTAQIELRAADGSDVRKRIDLKVVGIAATEIPGLGLVQLQLAEDALAWIATRETTAARDLRLAQQAAAALLFGGQVVAVDSGSSSYAALWVTARSVEDVRPVQAQIDAMGYAAFSQSAVVATVEDIFRAINGLLVAVAIAAFVLAGLGVLNALVTTISERTAEIGVLKALGATDADIARLVIAEALVLGAVGGVCGVVLGWAGAGAAAAAGRALSGPARLALETAPDPRVALAALLVTMALAALGAWLPAQRAARMAPAEALRVG